MTADAQKEEEQNRQTADQSQELQNTNPDDEGQDEPTHQAGRRRGRPGFKIREESANDPYCE
jgi:hypothetical protein